MSMFHELMMRKKEQIMYATIKGTLTENDGVFSGFSGSNYLELQNNYPLQLSSFELNISFSFSSFNTYYGILGYTSNGSSVGIYTYPNGNLHCILFKTKSNTTPEYTINYDIRQHLNEKLTLNIKTDGNKVEIKLYNENTLVVNNTYENQNLDCMISSNITYGKGYSLVMTTGSIDLNNSYIKLGSTKYNLQAVVGYTIVGSPTIVDGVVSGFSLSNYVKINTSTLNIGTTDFEIQTSFIANSIATTNIRILATDGSATTVLGFNLVANGNKLRFMYKGADNYLDSSLSSYEVNIKYYAKFYRKGNILGLEISTDKVNWIKDTKEYSGSLSFGNEFRLGVNVGGGTYFNGSIDLNETYIKVNNKLYFNGQQA